VLKGWAAEVEVAGVACVAFWGIGVDESVRRRIEARSGAEFEEAFRMQDRQIMVVILGISGLDFSLVVEAVAMLETFCYGGREVPRVISISNARAMRLYSGLRLRTIGELTQQTNAIRSSRTGCEPSMTQMETISGLLTGYSLVDHRAGYRHRICDW
jgi:hypothetical protein